jgi:hypothetical protein
LLSKQNPNGGWGESYVACVDKAYPSDGTSFVSMTDTYDGYYSSTEFKSFFFLDSCVIIGPW